ncbi:MAG: DUF3793 family protein [Trichloromonadaceae bacterium]
MLQTPQRHPKAPTWHQLALRFSGERECLAAFLAMETAEVLEGVKPANLINLADRRQPCGRNLFQLWQRHGRSLLAASGLAWLELPGRRGSLLLLAYQAEALTALLARPATQALLTRAGYANPADPEAALEQLAQRLTQEEFPHEIGVFLGYPLKDVAAFLGWVELPFTSQALWRIYGQPDRSLALADRFRQCRCRMAQRLRTSTAVECLLTGSDHGLFYAFIENDIHNHKDGIKCA